MTQLATSGNAYPNSVVHEQRQYLTFLLRTEPYAIDIMVIKEIIEFGRLTEVPCMPEFVRGVINLRGAVVPVIDLSARFGGNPSVVSRRTCIVIVEVNSAEGQQIIGVMVDAVSAVLDIPSTQIEPPPSFGIRIRADFVAGMGKIDNRFVIILDVNHVLSMDEMASLASAAQAALPH